LIGQPSWKKKKEDGMSGTQTAAPGQKQSGELGAAALPKAKSDKKQVVFKTAQERDLFLTLGRRAIEKKAKEQQREKCASLLNTFLDKVASAMPVARQGPLRQLQLGVALGRPLTEAIKLAYPRLPAEQRGIFALRLVKAATDSFERFVGQQRVQKEKQHSGPASSPETRKHLYA
jgi:hypothetical protein